MHPRSSRSFVLAVLAAFTVGAADYLEAAAREVPLIEAVKQGDVAAVRAMIAQKTDVNAAELDGSTAMHWAAHLNDAASMDLLLNAGANPRAVTRNGATPFSLACYVGNAAAIERLLAAGEDTNAVFSGEPALMMVARAGSADGVRALLARGANPNVAEPTRGQTALMWAAAEGHASVLEVLIEFGADAHARSKGPANTRVQGGRIPRVNDPLGLRAHRDPTYSMNNDGLEFTPIMWAARAGKIDAVKVLLDRGASVNDEKPNDGTTVLILAILNRHYELASYLLDRGADPNIGPGYTALQQLVWSRKYNTRVGRLLPVATGTLDSLDLAKKLIAKGVKIDSQATRSFRDALRNRFNRVGATAFLHAAKNADYPMMKLLVEAGADIHLTNADRDTPLQVAAGVAILNPNEDPGTETEVLNSVKYLVEELGFDVNTANANGETALHGAAYRGFNSVAAYLIDLGAKLDVENILGWKPITIADGLFYSGFFKIHPHTADFLRWEYVKKDVPPPAPPKVNDTTLLTLAEKFEIGDIVQEVPTGGYKRVEPGDVAGLQVDLFKVTELDPQSQVIGTEPYKPGP